MREHLYGASVDKCVGGNIGKNLAFGDPLISSMTTEIILQKKITYLQTRAGSLAVRTGSWTIF